MSSAAYMTDVNKANSVDPIRLHPYIHKSIMSAQYLQHKGLESDNNLALKVLIIV